MKIDCPSCGSEVSLDHKVFEDYDGPVKCFCCDTMMEIRIAGGNINAATLSEILPGHSKNSAVDLPFKHDSCISPSKIER